MSSIYILKINIRVMIVILYLCKVCDYDYSSKTQRYKTSCDYCDYKAQDKTVLSYHVKSDHEKQILECNFCDYKCRHQGTLTGHIRVKHLDEGINCDRCEFMAAWEKDLREHKREVHDRYLSICPELGCTYQVKSRKSFKKHTMKHGIRSEKTKCKKDQTVQRQMTKFQTETNPEEISGMNFTIETSFIQSPNI